MKNLKKMSKKVLTKKRYDEEKVLTNVKESLLTFWALAGNPLTGENVFHVDESDLRSIRSLIDLVVKLGAD